MRHGLAAHPNVPFDVPEGVSFAVIDRDTGLLAQPGCPRTYNEVFLAGTEPVEYCPLHREVDEAARDAGRIITP
jgi:membrane carboxypeptidase/penicillin-binding protein